MRAILSDTKIDRMPTLAKVLEHGIEQCEWQYDQEFFKDGDDDKPRNKRPT
jgi:hypothetical protein